MRNARGKVMSNSRDVNVGACESESLEPNGKTKESIGGFGVWSWFPQQKQSHPLIHSNLWPTLTRGGPMFVRALFVFVDCVICSHLASYTETCRWRMLGLISFLDPVRPDAKEAVEKANDMGIEVSISLFHAVVQGTTCKLLSNSITSKSWASCNTSR